MQATFSDHNATRTKNLNKRKPKGTRSAASSHIAYLFRCFLWGLLQWSPTFEPSRTTGGLQTSGWPLLVHSVFFSIPTGPDVSQYPLPRVFLLNTLGIIHLDP